MYKQKFKLHSFSPWPPMATTEIRTQIVHSKGRQQACSYLYSGYLKSWWGSCLPTTLLPSHLAKPIQESEVRRKILKELARTREGLGDRIKKEKVSPACCYGKISVYSFLGLIKTSTAHASRERQRGHPSFSG